LAILVLTPFVLIIVAGFLGAFEDKATDSGAAQPPQEAVKNSSWDGSVRQVERYLRMKLKDPESYQAIEWSKVVETPDGMFAVRHKYRAKNSFGGYVIEEKVFVLDAGGRVISHDEK